MSSTETKAIQLCPFSDYLTARLGSAFDVVPWFSMDPNEQDDWLGRHATEARHVVTGGHLGCPNHLIERLPALGIIAINGVGFDKVDLDFAQSRGVRVTNTPDVLTDDVADLAVGLVISLLRRIPASDAYLRAGAWLEGDMPLARQVSGKRFGIVGLGRIGVAIAARLNPFGPIVYTDLIEKECPYRFVRTLADLAQESDVLILASSANAATKHIVGKEVLEALGPSGFLVNVARGSLVDEAALIAALAGKRIAGAALDVFEDEPRVPDPLRSSSAVVLTPHIASATVETRMRMADLVLENLQAFVDGRALPTAIV